MSEISVHRPRSAVGGTCRTPRVTEIAIVVVADRVDPPSVTALQRRIALAVAVGRAVVVDLRAVSDLGGHGMDLLLDALRDVIRGGATLAIAGGRPAIDGIESHPSLGAALAAAARASGGRPGLRAN